MGSYSTDRWPPAPGFTEAQLNDVQLVTVNPATVPAAIGSVLMLIATFRMPYDFYIVLRWAAPVMAIWIWTIASRQHRTGWALAMAGVAILFNPIIPFTMPRESWTGLNYLSLVLFWAAGVKTRASRPATDQDGGWWP